MLGPFQLEGTYGVGVRSLEDKDTKLGAVFSFPFFFFEALLSDLPFATS